jgi:DNA-binding response OmpR family regulator
VFRKDSRPLLILHVEDDDNDAILFQKACARAGFPAEIHRVDAADEAQTYLLGRGAYADRATHPLPQVIVLDLKIPRMDGFEFLKWLRNTEAFAALPVLVFSASGSGEDKFRALADGADSYFVKPVSFKALVQMVEGFEPPERRARN